MTFLIQLKDAFKSFDFDLNYMTSELFFALLVLKYVSNVVLNLREPDKNSLNSKDKKHENAYEILQYVNCNSEKYAVSFDLASSHDILNKSRFLLIHRISVSQKGYTSLDFYSENFKYFRIDSLGRALSSVLVHHAAVEV